MLEERLLEEERARAYCRICVAALLNSVYCDAGNPLPQFPIPMLVS